MKGSPKHSVLRRRDVLMKCRGQGWKVLRAYVGSDRASNSGEYIVKIGGIVDSSWRISSLEEANLPSLLPCESLVEKDQDFGHVELYVFQVEIFLIVLLHLEKIVQFQVEFEKTAITSLVV